MWAKGLIFPSRYLPSWHAALGGASPAGGPLAPGSRSVPSAHTWSVLVPRRGRQVRAGSTSLLAAQPALPCHSVVIPGGTAFGCEQLWRALLPRRPVFHRRRPAWPLADNGEETPRANRLEALVSSSEYSRSSSLVEKGEDKTKAAFQTFPPGWHFMSCIQLNTNHHEPPPQSSTCLPIPYQLR